MDLEMKCGQSMTPICADPVQCQHTKADLAEAVAALKFWSGIGYLQTYESRLKFREVAAIIIAKHSG